MAYNNNQENNQGSSFKPGGMGNMEGAFVFSFLSDNSFSPSVLYIEDNYSHILLVKRILETIPAINFKSATTAEEGLKLAIIEKPDLVILDMRMPVIDGYEILESLTLHPLTRHVPVIALSASAMRHEIEKGMSLGLKRYLTKPVHIRELLMAVQEELDQVYALRHPG